MARTKQTARKNTGGKTPAKTPAKFPVKPQRKVILEYSSDENGNQQVPSVELGKPKRVVKRITLTLPTKPANVTLTESFHRFFMRHGLNKALQKALESQGWTIDQMQEFQTNYTVKHGTKIPPPKLYMDEGDSEDEGLELNDGTVYGGRAAAGAKLKTTKKHWRCRLRSWKRPRVVVVQAEELEGAQVAPVEQVALVKQVAQGEWLVAAVVVAEETLWETPTEAESMAVKMTTTMMIRTRKPSRILQGERARDRRLANLVVAELAKAASSPE